MGIMIIGFILHTIIGYNLACLLTRFTHYVKYDKNANTTNRDDGDIPDAWLGINGDPDKEGKVEFSNIYCFNEDKENTSNKGSTGDQTGGDGKNKTIPSMGITSDKPHSGHHLLVGKLYNYDVKCSDYNKPEGTATEVGMKKTSAMLMGSYRGSFKYLMEKLTNDKKSSDYTDTKVVGDDANAVMKKQLDTGAMPWIWSLVVPLFAILIIGSVVAIPFANVILGFKGKTHSPLFSSNPFKFFLSPFVDFFGIGMYLILFGLVGGFVGEFRDDAPFPKGTPYNVKPNFFGENGYLTTKAFGIFTLLWGIGTIFKVLFAVNVPAWSKVAILALTYGLILVFGLLGKIIAWWTKSVK